MIRNINSLMHVLAIVYITAVATFAYAGETTSGKIKSPEDIPGSVKVTAEGFIDLVDTIPNLIVIDSRIPGDRKQGYVEGSISLPDIETSCKSLATKIPAKDSPTLFYCNGVKCGRSAKAVKIALKCGYKKVYWFRGGFEEWLAKGFPYLQE